MKEPPERDRDEQRHDAQERLFSGAQLHAAIRPLALQALIDKRARLKMRAADAAPQAAAEIERMLSMTFEDVWSRAVANAWYARSMLSAAATTAPPWGDSDEAVATRQFWRDRIAALDDVLLGLALARQKLTRETRAAVGVVLQGGY